MNEPIYLDQRGATILVGVFLALLALVFAAGWISGVLTGMPGGDPPSYAVRPKPAVTVEPSPSVASVKNVQQAEPTEAAEKSETAEEPESAETAEETEKIEVPESAAATEESEKIEAPETAAAAEEPEPAETSESAAVAEQSETTEASEPAAARQALEGAETFVPAEDDGGHSEAGEAPVKCYAVQVGSFHSRGNAEKLARSLHAKGYDATVKAVTTADGKTWHAVRLGFSDTRDDARQAAARYTRDEGGSPLIIRTAPDEVDCDP